MKKHKVVSLLIAAVITIGCFVLPKSSSDDFATAAGDVTEITSADVGYEIFDINGKDVVAIYEYYGKYERISVPEEIDGYPVGYLETFSFDVFLFSFQCSLLALSSSAHI